MSLFVALSTAVMLSSCNKDDDDDSTVNITVLKNGQAQSGVTVYMFSESNGPMTTFFQPFYCDNSVATNANGIATFDLGKRESTLYFGVFEGSNTSAICLGYAAITIKKGETKSATINIGGSTTYDDGTTTNENGNSSTSDNNSNNNGNTSTTTEAKGVIDVTLTVGSKYVPGATIYLYDVISFDAGKQYTSYAIGYIVTDDKGVAKYNVPAGAYYLVYWNTSTTYYKHAVNVVENQVTTVSFKCNSDKNGTLTLINTSSNKYAVTIDGVKIGYLNEYSYYDVPDLEIDVEHEVIFEKYDGTNNYAYTRSSEKFIFTKDGEKKTYSFPSLATVTIKHSSSDTYYAYIDGIKVATWTKSGTYSYEVSAGVQHKLYVEQQDGYLFKATTGTKTFTLEAGKNVTYSGPISGTNVNYFN